MMQVKELTKDQKIQMYNKLTKRELIEMLISANEQIARMAPSVKLYDLQQDVVKMLSKL